MEIMLDINKTVEENAAIYYEKSKKSKKKLAGAQKALAEARERLAKAVAEKDKAVAKIEKEEKEKKEQQKRKAERKKHWYDKFRWFISSTGFLVVGGRDATTNEILIKKHTDKEDLVLHTELAGSPLFVIKANRHEGKTDEQIDEQTKKEAAEATASYSKAWKRGLLTTEVYCITPEQVSKTAKSGEYLKKGSFMIYGKREYFNPDIKLAIGKLKDGRIMAGPASAVKANCKKFLFLEHKRGKKSDSAQKIKHKLGGDIDEIMQALPPGDVGVVTVYPNKNSLL